MNAPQFKDRFAREWPIEVTVALLPALADAGLDLAKADAVNPAGMVAGIMTADAWQAGRILWILCSAQAAERNIDHYGFAKGLNADALCSGSDAVVLAVSEYLLRLTIKRQLEKEEIRRITPELNKVRASMGLPPLGD